MLKQQFVKTVTSILDDFVLVVDLHFTNSPN